jgi:hypothetical protein
MNLLDEIVDLLSDKKGSLTDALLKTKVLMHRIGHKELAEWVNDELNGYPKDRRVPSYRIIGSRVVGHIQNIRMIYGSQPLPTGHLPEEIQKYLHEHEMRDSISVLEQFTTDPDKHLTMPLGPEFYSPISQALEGAWVQKAWIQMEPTQIMHGLTEIRSRLLDFVLDLQDKLGDVEDSEVKNVAKNIDAPTMFQHTVFGDNTTIVVGNQNATTVKNIVKRGDFASLAAALKLNGVGDVDIGALQTAIDQDKVSINVEKKELGPAVKGWMARMMSKAIDASWQIELGVAAGLITEALRSYYFS